MRLVFEDGLSPVQRGFARVVRALVGTLPGPIQVFSYRKRLFGLPVSDCFQQAMRGRSRWLPGERELMAAITSKTVHCAY